MKKDELIKSIEGDIDKINKDIDNLLVKQQATTESMKLVDIQIDIHSSAVARSVFFTCLERIKELNE